MIAADQLIKIFQTMYKEHWSYDWGAAERGCVDCSGAFVYAYRSLGASIAHGSNAIARQYIRSGMLPIAAASPGMAAFKAKTPNESGYDLPGKYREGGSAYTRDINDYYHIGLVDEDPRFVLNAKSKSQGFCRDQLTIKNGWDFVAPLKDIEYSEKEETHMNAKVVLPQGASGTTVNMRTDAKTSAKLICRVPVGSEVEVLYDQGTWCQISYEDTAGWMMSNYLEYIGQIGESDGGDLLKPEDLDKIEKALQTIETQINQIRDTLGRG